MQNQDKTQITIKAIVSATPEKVWSLWTEPKHIVKWNAASDDWHTTKAENDLRVGGKFSSRMEAKDGSFGFDFGGTYTTVEPYRQIAYTLEDDRKVIIDFQHQITVQQEPAECFEQGQPSSPSLTRLRAIARKYLN